MDTYFIDVTSTYDGGHFNIGTWMAFRMNMVFKGIFIDSNSNFLWHISDDIH